MIGHVGRFTGQKNQSFIVEIFNEILKRVPDSELWFIGKGPMMPQIEEKVKSLHLETKVKFFGQISNVNQYMQGMDAFVFPSLYEGLGIVAVEAQCAGLKTFCSKAIPEEAKLTELLLYLDEKNDAQDWASCIVREAKNYKRKDQSEQIVTSGYDIQNTAKWLETFYSKKYNL